MAASLWYLPAVAAFLLLCLFVTIPYSGRLDRLFSRVAFALSPKTASLRDSARITSGNDIPPRVSA